MMQKSQLSPLTAWLSCFFLIGAIHPTLGAMLLPGYDAPLKLLFVTLVFILAGDLAIQSQYKFNLQKALRELLCVTLVVIPLFVLISSWNSSAFIKQVFIFISFLMLYALSASHRIEIRKLESILSVAIVVVCLIAFIECLMMAFQRGQFYIGLMRYDINSDLNLNHLAVLFPLGFFAALNLSNSASKWSVIIMTLVATIMLLSRAAIMGFLVAMIIYLIRSYPKLINLILLSFFIVCSLIIFYIEYIFETNGLILDALSSGRFRLWYYASDQGTYELFSTKLQDDENLTYLTKKSGHDTAYLHNSYLYTLLNFGKVYYFCFIIILIYVSNRLLYFRDSLIFILMMYIIFCSFFESLLDFQKLGLLFYSLIFFILKMDYRYMKRESVCD